MRVKGGAAFSQIERRSPLTPLTHRELQVVLAKPESRRPCADIIFGFPLDYDVMSAQGIREWKAKRPEMIEQDFITMIKTSLVGPPRMGRGSEGTKVGSRRMDSDMYQVSFDLGDMAHEQNRSTTVRTTRDSDGIVETRTTVTTETHRTSDRPSGRKAHAMNIKTVNWKRVCMLRGEGGAF